MRKHMCYAMAKMLTMIGGFICLFSMNAFGTIIIPDNYPASRQGLTPPLAEIRSWCGTVSICSPLRWISKGRPSRSNRKTGLAIVSWMVRTQLGSYIFTVARGANQSYQDSQFGMETTLRKVAGFS